MILKPDQNNLIKKLPFLLALSPIRTQRRKKEKKKTEWKIE